jgi:hypothetical protein
MKNNDDFTIAVIYDHREILNPLFQALTIRGINYKKLNSYDLSFALPPDGLNYSLVYNDITAPPYQFKTAGASNLTNEYLSLVETYEPSVQIVNGSDTADLIFSKAKQLALFTRHGFPLPKTIITTARNIPAAAYQLQFPIVIKEVANHADSLFTRIENHSEFAERLVNNFFADDGGLPVVVQEWVEFKNDELYRLDLIKGEIARATTLKVMQHPDYVNPFLLEPTELNVTGVITNAVRELSLTSGLELASIEYSIDRKTNDLVFLGIHPHTTGYQSTVNSDYRLAELTVRHLEKRLSKISELSHYL